MPPQTIHTIICPECHAELPATADRCERCSAATARREVTREPTAAGRAKAGRLSIVSDTPWAMVMLLFLVTAGFGLPILWKSRAFSTKAKVVLTIIVSFYTVVVVWLILIGGAWVIEKFTEIGKALIEIFEIS